MSWVRAAAALVCIALAAVVAVVVIQSRRTSPPPQCQVGGPSGYVLDLEQAANAATIAAAGLKAGLPDHAVTIALATALQESGLHNLDHGDLDSLGLFQQRPSQGWGTRSQIMSPPHAAAAFYARLGQLSSWQTMSVADAAQGVQRSAAPAAYSSWEAQARAMAIALTGEKAEGLSCRYQPAGRADPAAAAAAAAAELGMARIDVTLPTARGWAVATWLVGHASRYNLAAVSYAGRRWTASTGTWSASPSTDLTVRMS